MRKPLPFAAALLLAAPVLVHAQDTVLTGRVTTRDDGLPLPGATVAVAALNLTALSDAEGSYTLTIPASAAGQTVEVAASAPGLRGQTWKLAVAPGAVTHDFALGLSFHEEITVGSRAPGAEDEKAVPVDVFTARDIQMSGASETSQAIQRLSPSFNFPRPTISDGADTVRPATLRGLGPDQVLVLVNGKRRHTSAHIVTSGVIGRGTTGVDLNAIPASAIQKVEVLRDGAAAQYGSDAIAGVINIVLKSGAEPFTVTGKAGQTLGSYEDLTGADRDHSDGELTEATGTYGARLGRGSLFAAVEYRNRNGTQRASPDVRDQLAAGDAGSNPVEQPNHHWGDSEERDVLAWFNSTFPLDAGNTRFLYAYGGWSRRDGSHGGFYRRALDARNWPQIYPLGFLPTIQPDVVDGSGTLGARGAWGGSWFWDLSAQYGHNRFDFNVVNSLNASLGPDVPPNQTEFYSGSLAFGQFLVNADFSHALDIGLREPVNLAFGAEYRHENFEQTPGEPASYVDGGFANQLGGRAEAGTQVFPGFRPSNAADASRNSVAAYLDLEGDLHEKVRLGLAGRVEDYDDFGSTVDGKVTLRVAPHPRFVLRGAASTGFRAPSLAQSSFSSVATNFISVGGVVQPVEVGTFSVESPVARALGAQPLEPEESVHYSAGFALSPVDRLEMTLDYYRIDIDGRVVFSGNFTGPRIEALVRPFGANGGRFFTNAIDTETEGFDATVRYRFDLGATGNLVLSAAYNHTENEIVGEVATPPQLAGFENVLFDRVERLRLVCGQPEDNLRLAADWQRGGFGSVLRVGRYGEYCFATPTEANDQTFGAEWLVDLELAWTRNRLTLAAGVQNAFDEFPDQLRPANSSFVVQTFPSTSPFGFNGRFIYGKVGLRF
jgi:iron complex outermembrane receptor protein